MKPNKIISVLFFAALGMIALQSCAGLSADPASGSEYRQGYQDAESYAKQDAMHENCITGYPKYRLELFKHRRNHVEALKGKYSGAYISGFHSGYTDFFIEYIDLYCGD